MRARALPILVLIVLVLVPSIAVADVGTPLIWMEGIHLVVGNLLLGVLEGAILVRLYRIKLRRSVGLLVLANYFSSWVGFAAVGKLGRWLNPDLHSGMWTALGLIGATYALTLVLEWPFVVLCFRGTPHWLRRSVTGSLIVQTASYVLLFGVYAPVSAASLYTGLSVVPREQVSLPLGVQVFFIGERDGDVYRLAGVSAAEKVFAFRSANPRDSLRLEQQPGDPGAWDVVAVRAERWWRADSTVVALRGSVRNPHDSAWNSTQGRGRNLVPRIGSAGDSPWRFRTSPWPSEGIRGRHERTGETLRLAFGTPILSWPIWGVTQLPDDKVLFGLGWDQICVLEVATRRVALLAKGHGMIAVVAAR